MNDTLKALLETLSEFLNELVSSNIEPHLNCKLELLAKHIQGYVEELEDDK